MATVAGHGRKSGGEGEGEDEASKRTTEVLCPSEGFDLSRLTEGIRERALTASKKEFDEENLMWWIFYTMKELQDESISNDASKKKGLGRELSRMMVVIREKKLELEELEEKLVAVGKMVCKSDDAMITEAEKMKRIMDEYEEFKRNEEEKLLTLDPELAKDPYALEARLFEQRWTKIYGRMGYGNFKDNTSLSCKFFTSDPAPCGGTEWPSLQVFSVKVTELKRALQWPVNVFGLVALRDSLDHKRNIIF